MEIVMVSMIRKLEYNLRIKELQLEQCKIISAELAQLYDANEAEWALMSVPLSSANQMK